MTRPAPGYRAVLFDFAGVITRPMAEMFAPLVAAAGVDGVTLLPAMLSVFASDDDTDSIPHRAERGEIRHAELLAWVDEQAPGAGAMLDPASPHFFGNRLRLHDDMPDVVDELRRRGFKTAIVSNMFEAWQPAVDRVFTYQDRFDTLLWSWEVGLRKPNTAIFELALERLGVEPDEAVYLDDFPAMADGARAAGIESIDVADHEQALARLSEVLA